MLHLLTIFDTSKVEKNREVAIEAVLALFAARLDQHIPNGVFEYFYAAILKSFDSSAETGTVSLLDVALLDNMSAAVLTLPSSSILHDPFIGHVSKQLLLLPHTLNYHNVLVMLQTIHYGSMEASKKLIVCNLIIEIGVLKTLDTANLVLVLNALTLVFFSEVHGSDCHQRTADACLAFFLAQLSHAECLIVATACNVIRLLSENLKALAYFTAVPCGCCL